MVKREFMEIKIDGYITDTAVKSQTICGVVRRYCELERRVLHVLTQNLLQLVHVLRIHHSILIPPLLSLFPPSFHPSI